MTLQVTDLSLKTNAFRVDISFKGGFYKIFSKICAYIYDDEGRQLGVIENNKESLVVLGGYKGGQIFKLALNGDICYCCCCKQTKYHVKRFMSNQEVAVIGVYTQRVYVGHGNYRQDKRMFISISTSVDIEERALLLGLAFTLNFKLGLIEAEVCNVSRDSEVSSSALQVNHVESPPKNIDKFIRSWKPTGGRYL